jgi:hypothetical protein
MVTTRRPAETSHGETKLNINCRGDTRPADCRTNCRLCSPISYSVRLHHVWSLSEVGAKQSLLFRTPRVPDSAENHGLPFQRCTSTYTAPHNNSCRTSRLTIPHQVRMSVQIEDDAMQWSIECACADVRVCRVSGGRMVERWFRPDQITHCLRLLFCSCWLLRTRAQLLSHHVSLYPSVRGDRIVGMSGCGSVARSVVQCRHHARAAHDDRVPRADELRPLTI